MSNNAQSDWTRGRIVHAAVLIVMLLVPIIWSWGHSGPSADEAFTMVMIYFVELVLWIAMELIFQVLRGADDEA